MALETILKTVSGRCPQAGDVATQLQGPLQEQQQGERQIATTIAKGAC